MILSCVIQKKMLYNEYNYGFKYLSIVGQQISVQPSYGPLAGGTVMTITAKDSSQLLNVLSVYFGDDLSSNTTTQAGCVTLKIRIQVSQNNYFSVIRLETIAFACICLFILSF